MSKGPVFFGDSFRLRRQDECRYLSRLTANAFQYPREPVRVLRLSEEQIRGVRLKMIRLQKDRAVARPDEVLLEQIGDGVVLNVKDRFQGRLPQILILTDEK